MSLPIAVETSTFLDCRCAGAREVSERSALVAFDCIEIDLIDEDHPLRGLRDCDLVVLFAEFDVVDASSWSMNRRAALEGF
jgi:hypothetical protein